MFDHTGKGVERFDTVRTPYEMEYTIQKLLQQRQDYLDEQKKQRKATKKTESENSQQ